MILKPLLLIASMTIITGSALAAPTIQSGDLTGYPYFDNTAPSSLSRSTVRAEAVAANARHPLAGEVAADMDPLVGTSAPPSALTRAQVKSEVLAARAAGTLPAAGEVGYPYHAPVEPTGRFAATAHPMLSHLGRWISGRGAGNDVVGAN